MVEKEQYVIEREYLGIMSVREFMGMIIKKNVMTTDVNVGNQIMQKPLKTPLIYSKI